MLNRVLSSLTVFLVVGCQGSLNLLTRSVLSPNSNQGTPAPQQVPAPTRTQYGQGPTQQAAYPQTTTPASQADRDKQLQDKQAAWQAKQTDESKKRDFCMKLNMRAMEGGKALSCQELKDIEADSAQCSSDGQSNMYKIRLDHLRKVSSEAQLAEPVRNCYVNRLYYELGDQPDGLHTGDETPEVFVARIKGTNAKELECLGSDEKAKVLNDLMDLTLKQSTLLRSKEADCRKSKKCIEHRQDLKGGDDICSSIAAIKMSQDQIRAERSNPSGVVSLTSLHEAGEMIQMSQVQLREQKAEFRKTYKREFPESVCREIWSKPDDPPPGDPRTTCQPHAGPSGNALGK